jgi:hypothetical protein
VNARFAHGDLRTDTLSLASTFYDTLGQGTVSTTKTIGYAPNLELYYPMDAAAPVSDTNSLVHDVTANARNGTPSGGAKLVRDMADNNNQAYFFDGTDDQITVTGYTGINGNAARSVSLWVQTSYPKTTNSYVSWGTNSTNQKFSFGHDPNSGEVYFHSFSRTKSGQKRIVDGGWHHVAVTFSNDGTPEISDLQFYVDGVAVSQSAITNDVINTIAGSNVLIGRDLQGGAWLRGKLDEVRLYSRALTATEIKKLAVKVPSGLVAQYPLDNSGTENSGNTSDLTLINSPAAANDRYVRPNSALTFNATNTYGTVADQAAMRFTTGNSITLAGWINPSGVGTQRTIVAKGRTSGSNNANYVLRCLQAGDVLNFYFHSGGSLKEFRSTNAVCNSAIWMHVAVTYQFGSASSAQLYVNGLAVSGSWTSGSGNETPDSPTDPLFVGAINDGSLTHVFSGQLGDIRVYNRVLTAGEVKALATELDRGLVAYYPLDESSSASISDYSGSGNNGVGQGATGAQNLPQTFADRNGNASSAMQFGGTDDRISIGSLTNLPMGNAARTICAWVKHNTANSDYEYIINYGAASAGQKSGLLRKNTGTIPMYTFHSTDLQSPCSSHLNLWYHICGTSDGSNNHAIYINGNSEATLTFTHNTTGTQFNIGSHIGGTVNFQNGVIDDVRIYNRKLSLAEIREMSGFYPAHVANLKAWVDASRIGDPANTSPGADLKLWKDLSLNSGDVAQNAGGSSNIPDYIASQINGLPAINFTGSEYSDMGYSPNLNTTAHTELIVFRASGGVKREIITQGNNSLIYGYNTGPVLQTGIGGGSVNSTTAYVDNTWTIGGLTYGNPGGTFYRNGAADGTFSQVAASDTSGWRLGSDSLVGDVAEIVMYERVLTAAELEKVNCYFNKKYAIAVSGLVCE